MAETYAFLGDRDKAYKYLDELNKVSSYVLGYLISLRHSQMFAGIRNEERFQKILQNEEVKIPGRAREGEEVAGRAGEEGLKG